MPKSANPKFRSALWTLALCSFFVGLDAIVTVPLLPAITKTAAMEETIGALLVAAYALTYMISAPLFGAISDRVGRKKMMTAGMIVLAAGTLLTGFGQNLTELLIFRAVTGLGAGMLEPGIMAWVGDKVPYSERGRAMGIVVGALIASTLFGVPLGAYVSQMISWRWTFWGIGAAALLMLIPMAAFVPPDGKKGGEFGSQPARSLLREFGAVLAKRPVLFAMLATFLWFGGLQGMFANLGIYYNMNFGLEAGRIGLILMAAGLGSVIGTTFGGKLADKVGKKAVIGCAAVFTACGVLGLSLIQDHVWLAIGVHVLWSTAFGFGHAALNALITEVEQRMRGTVMALNSSVMYSGMMAATSASAALLQTGSFLPVGILCAASALIVLPVTVLLIPENAPAAETSG